MLQAITEMNKGMYDANLGGSVYKKRIAYGGKGKRGGARTILAFRAHTKAFFIYGFAKNEIDNISTKDEDALKILAKVYLNLTEIEIETALSKNELIEVINEKIHT